jgi:hypothetical protein
MVISCKESEEDLKRSPFLVQLGWPTQQLGWPTQQLSTSMQKLLEDGAIGLTFPLGVLSIQDWYESE